MRKYRPHNSSLTMGYREVHESELRNIRDKQAQKRDPSNSQHPRKLFRKKKSVFATTQSKHSSASGSLALQQIFSIYETERQQFDHLKN